MNVLVVDDDRSTRYLLKRTLANRFRCEVTEAGDGQQALDALAAGTYQLAILDVQMPGVDGLEALRDLRESAQHASLPVVMLTGERDETTVREILNLGVLEFMAKPLNMSRLPERIRRILRTISARRDGAPPEAGWLSRALLDTSTPALIIEGRQPYRAFFAEAMGAYRPVIQAESGVRGMRESVDSGPGVIFIGDDLGVLSEPLLLKRLRSTPAVRSLPLIALVDGAEEADARLASYDGTLVRTAAADTLFKQVGELARLSASSGWDRLGVPPGLRATVMLLCERTLGTALAGDVVLCDVPVVAAADRIIVSAGGWLPDGGGITLELACDEPTARRTAANLFGIDFRLIRGEDAESAVARVFDAISTGLSSTYGEDGQSIEFEPPAVARRADDGRGRTGGEGVALCFQGPSREHEFWLSIRPWLAG